MTDRLEELKREAKERRVERNLKRYGGSPFWDHQHSADCQQAEAALDEAMAMVEHYMPFPEQLIDERDEARAEAAGHKANREENLRLCQEAIRQRDEARALADQLADALPWYHKTNCPGETRCTCGLVAAREAYDKRSWK